MGSIAPGKRCSGQENDSCWEIPFPLRAVMLLNETAVNDSYFSGLLTACLPSRLPTHSGLPVTHPVLQFRKRFVRVADLSPTVWP
jgi:hypothetical protein